MNQDIEQLWNDYYFEIRSYIAKRMAKKWGQDVVSDLVSQVYAKAMIAIKNGNGYKDNARGWIYQVTRSVIADHMRLQHYKTFHDIDEFWDLEDGQLSPHELAEQRIIVQHVRGAVSRLDTRQREAMQLRLEGYNNRQIASELGVNEVALRQINVRAFRTLREWLQREAA